MNEKRFRGETNPPFKKNLLDMETPYRNYESRVRELESQGFVVKEIKIEHEDLLEAAQEKYRKSLELLQENGFGEFLPETFVIIGEGSGGKPSIYIAQEEIEGSHYDEVIDPDTDLKLIDYYRKQLNAHSLLGDEAKKSKPDFEKYPGRDILEKMDELALKSLKLWEKTRDLPPEEKKKLPIATAFKQETRRPRKNEGLMPEIMNPINMMYGRRLGKDKSDRLFLVDTGLVALNSDLIFSSRFPNGKINDVQRNLERSFPLRLLAKIKEKLIQLSDKKTFDEFKAIFPCESGKFYEQLQQRYRG